MTTWDRYLLGRLWAVFWRTVLVIVAFFVVIDLLTHRRGAIVEQEVPPLEVLRYYLLLIPTVLLEYQAAAMAVFISTLLILGKVTQHQESIALLSGGVALRRIVRAVALFGLMVSMALFAMSQSLTPWAAAEADAFESQYFGKSGPWSPRARNDITWSQLPGGWMCHVKTFNRKAMAGEGVFLTRTTADEFQLIEARSIYWDPAQMQWFLEQGKSTRAFPKEGMSQVGERFARIPAPFSATPESLLVAEIDPSHIRLATGRELIRAREAQGKLTHRLRLHVHSIFAQPLLALVLAALAIPFAMRNRRGGGIAFSFALCVACGILYMLLFSISQGLGASGRLHPIVAAWLANGLFALLALILLSRADS